MTSTDRLKKDMDQAVNDLSECPDTVVLAIFKNDLRLAIAGAFECGYNVADLDAGIRHASSRIPIIKIKQVLKKWVR